MDRNERVGHKTGSGAPLSYSQEQAARKERLRRLALETTDLNKDPYYSKNKAGQTECRLCLTTHTNEAAYLAHTQGRKHQTNLAQRVKKVTEERQAPSPVTQEIKRVTIDQRLKIGRPAFVVTKLREPNTEKRGILFEVQYPEISETQKIHYRLMTTYEQTIEPHDPDFQYLVLAAHPYDSIGFKIPNLKVDLKNVTESFHPAKSLYRLQIIFSENKNEKIAAN